jgi:hypothetical protein
MNRIGVPLPRALAGGVLALLLAGCASEREFEYPEFEQWSTLAPQPDCASVVLELRRVDAVRWSMREDGLDLASDSSQKLGLLGVLAGVAVTPLVPPVGIELAGRSAGYAFSHGPEHTLEQADRRLVRLLQRKRDLGCPPAPTAASGLSDMDLLAGVEALNRRRKAGEIPDWREAELRSRLMDDLHASGWRKQ